MSAAAAYGEIADGLYDALSAQIDLTGEPETAFRIGLATGLATNVTTSVVAGITAAALGVDINKVVEAVQNGGC